MDYRDQHSGTYNEWRSGSYGRRRPWTPLSVPGCFAWYDLSQQDGTDGDGVSILPDLSGNGRHATAAGTARPTFKRPPIGLTNAKFDGTANTLSVSFGSTIPQPTTIYFVARSDTNGAGTSTLFDGLNARQLFRFVNGQLEIFAGNVCDAGAGTAGTTWAVYAAVFNGANSYLYRNGVAVMGPVNAGTNGIGGVQFGAFSGGGTYFWNGAMGEWIGYAGAHDSGTVTQVSAGLGLKWGRFLSYPFNIPGLRGWWRASNILGVANGTAVTKWADYSGFGYDAATIAGSPLYTATGAGGRPTVTFGGSEYLWANIPSGGMPAPVSALCVSRNADLAGGSWRCMLSSGAAWNSLGISADSPSKWYHYFPAISSADNVDANPHAWAIVDSAGASGPINVYRDRGTSPYLTTASAANAFGPLNIGSGTDHLKFWVGSVSEVVLCQTALTSGDLAVWNAYVAGEYGI